MSKAHAPSAHKAIADPAAEPKEPTVPNDGECPPCEPPAPCQDYLAACDQLAAGVKKLIDAGMGGGDAGRLALELYCKCK